MLEQQLSPKGTTRLLPYLVAYHDSCSMPPPRPEPKLTDVPPSAADPQAALTTMRDAWDRHRAIADRLTRWQDPLARLAAATSRIVAFQLHGRPGDCTMIALERGNLSFEDGLVHAWKHPAVRWPDGSGHWYWRGIQLPETLSRKLPKLGAAEVAQIQNAELRRLALEYVGAQAFLRRVYATRAAQDAFGTLWRTMRVDGDMCAFVGTSPGWAVRPRARCRVHARHRISPDLDVPAQRRSLRVAARYPPNDARGADVDRRACIRVVEDEVAGLRRRRASAAGMEQAAFLVRSHQVSTLVAVAIRVG